MLFEGYSLEQMANSLMGVRLTLSRGSSLMAVRLPLRGATVVLVFTRDGRADGFSGVNFYRGSVQFPALGQVEFPSMFATTRMSGPEPLMTLERAYLEALSKVKRSAAVLERGVNDKRKRRDHIQIQRHPAKTRMNEPT